MLPPPFPPFPCPKGLNLVLNDIRTVYIHIKEPKNCEFNTNIGRLQLFLHVISCELQTPTVHLNGIGNVNFHLRDPEIENK